MRSIQCNSTIVLLLLLFLLMPFVWICTLQFHFLLFSALTLTCVSTFLLYSSFQFCRSKLKVFSAFMRKGRFRLRFYFTFFLVGLNLICILGSRRSLVLLWIKYYNSSVEIGLLIDYEILKFGRLHAFVIKSGNKNKIQGG